jgi:hypothetical protein
MACLHQIHLNAIPTLQHKKKCITFNFLALWLASVTRNVCTPAGGAQAAMAGQRRQTTQLA